ncbi:MAG: heme-copper oxidase subunit III [Flavobacteriales bacterium]|nr:heme-copper oxidase subunit III [Flavobacteriales bacterium]MCB9185322.1 heme-copper oxidase subunit III [Flavobacteriales bacterium]
MEENNEQTLKQERAKKMLVWLAVASIAMFFAAFTSAYIVLQADHFWVQDELPRMFTISTVILLVSSLTIYLAKRSVSSGNSNGLKLWIAVTFVLGLAFTATQYLGWKDLQARGMFFIGTLNDLKGEYGEDFVVLMKGEPLLYDSGNYYKPGDIDHLEPINDRIEDTFNISASFLYLLTGMHILHLAGGFIWLIVLLLQSFSGRISQQNTLPLELGSIYWHFLDILWIYLFLFLLFIR